MSKNRKALFFDIDGTLFSEVNRNVPESAKQAVAKARKKGHLVFINTGRPYSLIGSIKQMIEVDGFCCGCGTRVVVGNEVLFSATIPHEQGKKIKNIIVEHNMDGLLEGTESCYVRKGRSRLLGIEKIKENLSKEGNLSEFGWDKDCYDFDKFCVMADEESNLAGFSKALGLDFQIINRGGGFYECVPEGYSKATAIELVLKHYEIALEDAYVFGDSTNDLSMFEYAKNSILMGHHDVELEPYASFFTKNVEEDGVAYAMEKLGLI
jgi:hypothetical protein